MRDRIAADRGRIWALVSIPLLLLLAGIPVLLSTVARQDTEREESEPAAEKAEEVADVTQKPRTFERSAIPEEVLARMRTVARPVKETGASTTSEERAAATSTATPAAARRQSAAGGQAEPGEKVGDSRVAASGEDRGMAVLDIEVDGERLDQVAAHFGYALAAFYLSAGDTALLGFFEGERLRFPSLEELQGFSGRGRSADRLPDRGLYIQVAARQSGLESGKIRLLFLVPRKVDEQWLQWQKAVVGRHGYRFEEVAAVRARYDADFELVARELVLKSGGVRSLEGGGL